jgi:tellurite resistance protein TehA-like permease
VLAAQGRGELGPILTGAGLLGGLVLWGFGTWWLALATLTTLRFIRQGLPFNLGWWAFTFPLGVFTASTFSLGSLTHLGFFTGLGEVFVPVLAVLWLLVTVRTAHSVWRGELLGKVPALPTTGLPHV